jgi:hypothetical protein
VRNGAVGGPQGGSDARSRQDEELPTLVGRGQDDLPTIVGLGQDDLPTLVGLGQDDLPTLVGLGADEKETVVEKFKENAPMIAADVGPRVQKLLEDLRENMRQVQAAERRATLIGVGGGVVGLGVGGAGGAFVGKGGADMTRRIVTTAGGAVGAFGLGMVSFFVSRRVLSPPMRGREVAKAITAAIATQADDAAADLTAFGQKTAGFYDYY